MTREERNELLLLILRLLAVGGLVLAAAAVPGAARMLEGALRKKRPLRDVPGKDLAEPIRYARSHRWIVVDEGPEGIVARLSKGGERRWRKLELGKPLGEDRWGGKWRLIIFDIPKKKDAARDQLRRALKQLGMIQLQESVWVTPYPCDPQVNALRHLYNLGPYVQMVLATEIENEERLLAKFHLEK